MHSVVVDGVQSITSKIYDCICIFRLLSKTHASTLLRGICTDREFDVTSKYFLL
jgi:hypothetical protein